MQQKGGRGGKARHLVGGEFALRAGEVGGEGAVVLQQLVDYVLLRAKRAAIRASGRSGVVGCVCVCVWGSGNTGVRQEWGVCVCLCVSVWRESGDKSVSLGFSRKVFFSAASFLYG